MCAYAYIIIELLGRSLYRKLGCAATVKWYHVVKSQVGEFHGLGFHSDLQFSQRIKVFEYAKEHNDEVFPPGQMLHIALAAQGFVAYLLDFCLVQQFYDLTIDRLSEKKIWFRAKCLNHKTLWLNADRMGNDLEMSKVHWYTTFWIAKERLLFNLQRQPFTSRSERFFLFFYFL